MWTSELIRITYGSMAARLLTDAEMVQRRLHHQNPPQSAWQLTEARQLALTAQPAGSSTVRGALLGILLSSASLKQLRLSEGPSAVLTAYERGGRKPSSSGQFKDFLGCLGISLCSVDWPGAS